jgi:hypothetical protein
MNLLGEIKNTSRDLVGCAGFVKVDIHAQLVVHFFVGVEGMLGGGLAIYIYCMVSTMDLKKIIL